MCYRLTGEERTLNCKERVLGPGFGQGRFATLLYQQGLGAPTRLVQAARTALHRGDAFETRGPRAFALWPPQLYPLPQIRESAIGKEGGQTSARRQAHPSWQAPAESQARFTGRWRTQAPIRGCGKVVARPLAKMTLLRVRICHRDKCSANVKRNDAWAVDLQSQTLHQGAIPRSPSDDTRSERRFPALTKSPKKHLSQSLMRTRKSPHQNWSWHSPSSSSRTC